MRTGAKYKLSTYSMAGTVRREGDDPGLSPQLVKLQSENKTVALSVRVSMSMCDKLQEINVKP